jgi:hypothetical protein
LVIEGETDDPQAAAQDIFKMLALAPELDEDVVASLQSLKRMLSKAKGSGIVVSRDAEKQRGTLHAKANRQPEGRDWPAL